MGLFDIFKKKKTDEKKCSAIEYTGNHVDADGISIKDLYDKMHPEMREKLFYGNADSAEEILTNICNDTFGIINNKNILFCNEIYVQVWIRSHGGFSPEFSAPTYIKESLLRRFNQEASSNIIKCIDSCISIIYSKEPKLGEMIMAYEARSNWVKENASKNIGLEKLHITDTDYGLVADKPVFVAGFEAAKYYLSSLKTVVGGDIEYNRLGSCAVKGICGNVDIYKINSTNENTESIIYICNYGNETSQTAPKGLKIENR